jgi:3-oxoacyl-[acyl-carrier protein] reductase
VRAINDGGGEATGIGADCTDPSAVEALRNRAHDAFGEADVLIAFAGGHGDPTPTAELSLKDWQFVIDANLTATFLTLQAFLPGMTEQGRGSIVTMASTAGRVAGKASASYAAAKAGVIMLSRRLAHEVGPRGVRVNCIAPGAVLTERMERRMLDEVQRQVAAMAPLGRMGTPQDIASTALFLASDSSSWLTGLTLDVAGGRSAGS